MRVVKNIISLAVITGGLGICGTAYAQTATGSLPVSATVLENCTVVATPLVFGALTEVGAADVDSTAVLTLTCTPNADFYVAMDEGANASSGARRMKNATSAEFLPYEIYTDNTYATVWGNTQGTDTVAGTAPTGVATLTAYGRIDEGVSSVSAGAYADTVTITVNF